MKNKLLIAVTALFALFAAGPGIVQAVTAEELAAQIAQLQAQLANINQTANQKQNTSSIPACNGITFTKNLTLGTTGNDVKCLQAILNDDPATVIAASGAGSPGFETFAFGGRTKDAVIRFQNKYAAEVLTPYGLASGTGFVGLATRNKLTSILGGVTQNCTAEGGINYFGTPACCTGLVNISNGSKQGTNCIATNNGAGICTKCDNGNCGRGENECNCPADCEKTVEEEKEPACAKTGKKIYSRATANGRAIECCSGLSAISSCDEDGECPNDGSSICSKCGNGACGTGENAYNCPDDCEEETEKEYECSQEGENGYAPYSSTTEKKCCAGLMPVNRNHKVGDGFCNIGTGNPDWVCAKCGDGNCGTGENRCNCAADCSDQGKAKCKSTGGNWNWSDCGKDCNFPDTRFERLNPTAVMCGSYCNAEYVCGCPSGKYWASREEGCIAQSCAAENELINTTKPSCCAGLVKKNAYYDCNTASGFDCSGQQSYSTCVKPQTCAAEYEAITTAKPTCCDGLVKKPLYADCATSAGTDCNTGNEASGYYCVKPTSCASEGQTILASSGGQACCSGLTAVSSCINGVCTNGSSVCTKCGNGICGTGENNYNCPADCPSGTSCSDSCKTRGYKDGYCKAWSSSGWSSDLSKLTANPQTAATYYQTQSCQTGEANIGWTTGCTAANMDGGDRACCCVSNTSASMKCSSTGGIWNLTTNSCSCPSYYSWCEDYGCQGMAVAMKPVIYLYPQTKTDVNLKLDLAGKLIADYPDYNPVTGWNVIANPDGRLLNKADFKEYSYLFWEANGYGNDYDMTQGFVVKGSQTKQFLQDVLAKIGLTPKEYNEFIVYWYPKMKDNPYNIIHFAGTEYTSKAKLAITPQPDSVLRVFMVFKPLGTEVKVTPQEFAPFDRKGFTVVEWGGSEIQ